MRNLRKQWRFDYIMDGKRTAFTFFSEDLISAMEYWKNHIKLDYASIFKISDINVLTNCDRCIKYPRFANIQGDGFCEKHNYRFSMGTEGQPCPMCAEEGNLCYSCGGKI